MLQHGFSTPVHERVTELRGRHSLGISFCFPFGSPLVTTYVHDQLSEVLLFAVVGTFYSRRAQAPAINYIRKTFRLKLITSFIPGFVPIGCELSNGAKEAHLLSFFGCVVGSHLFFDWVCGQSP